MVIYTSVELSKHSNDDCIENKNKLKHLDFFFHLDFSCNCNYNMVTGQINIFNLKYLQDTKYYL